MLFNILTTTNDNIQKLHSCTTHTHTPFTVYLLYYAIVLSYLTPTDLNKCLIIVLLSTMLPDVVKTTGSDINVPIKGSRNSLGAYTHTIQRAYSI